MKWLEAELFDFWVAMLFTLTMGMLVIYGLLPHMHQDLPNAQHAIYH
jgi:hypothetical protein